MSKQHSSYNFWTWLVAILLALILLWALLIGRASGTCCDAPNAVTPVEDAMPAVTEACAFSASNIELTSNDACANLAWLTKSDDLKTMLAGDLRANGDDKNVVLTGTVDSEDIKMQKGQEAQAFFGSDVAVDNQITVKAADVATAMPPPAAKLYFATGKTALKEEADASLAPIVDWLNANPSAKAVVSGFHDPSGNVTANEELSYNRAKAVQAALIAAGVDVMRIELRKPESVDGGSDLAEARRVEVSVE